MALSNAPAPRRRRVVILGLSITSSWGNGHATTYRGLARELSALGHGILFLERDVAWYADHRDAFDAGTTRIGLYRTTDELRRRWHAEIRDADLVIVGSYVPDGIEIGAWVTVIARGVTAFYDIDTPVTLAQLEQDASPYLTRGLIPRYHLYLSFTGGPVLEFLERKLRARRARALYCSVDSSEYFVDPQPAAYALGYMGTYSPDRQPGLDDLLLEPARRLPELAFAVAGPQYPDEIAWPRNVARFAHLGPDQHRRFYNRQRFTLNVTRAQMRRAGFSPSVRLFEAAACATPIISDDWPGLETFFEPAREILLARGPNDVLGYLHDLPDRERRAIGQRARQRVLAGHTAAHRARELLEYAELASV